MASEKHIRSIRLTPEIYERLNNLCEHLGVNANAYIVQAIGKAVSQDEIALVSKQSQSDFLAQFGVQLSQLIEEEKAK